jgi:putative ABC transport system substrate-binding protein
MQFRQLKRREFITLLGSAATAWPLAARAQQTVPVVAFVTGGTASASRLVAFRSGLGDTGYAERQNVTVEYHQLDGRYERLPALLAELVQRRVAIIAAPNSTAVALAAKAATQTIPIVFGASENPVSLGLVASLAHPGGNATGINFLSREVNTKRLGLMHELLPAARRFGVVLNPANISALDSKELQEAARGLGLEVLTFEARSADEIDAAFPAITRERCEGLFIAGDAFFTSRAVQFALLAARNALPASYASRDLVEAGLLMSYGVDFPDVFHQVGTYVGRILKGEKPADLPVQQSSKFEFVINMRTAKLLGVPVSNGMQLIADELIE